MTEGGSEPPRILLGDSADADVVSADPIPLLDDAASRGGIVKKRLLQSIDELPPLGGGGATRWPIGFVPRSHECFEVVMHGGAAVGFKRGINPEVTVYQERASTEPRSEQITARGSSVDPDVRRCAR